jgi:hypothetical protein
LKEDKPLSEKPQKQRDKNIDILCHNCDTKLDPKAKVYYSKILQKTTVLADGTHDVEFLYWVHLCEKCAEEEKEAEEYE